MFQTIKNWFFKKEEVKVSGTTKVELADAVFKAVPENFNPVKAAPAVTEAPALATEQVSTIAASDTISLANVATISYVSPPPVFTATVTATDQQAVVNAAEGSAVQAEPAKKPRKPRKAKEVQETKVEMNPSAAWPFPTEKPLAAVTPEELEALKTPAVIKVSKPRKKAAVVPKQG